MKLISFASGLLLLAGMAVLPAMAMAKAAAARHLLQQTYPTLEAALTADANRSLLLAAVKASSLAPLISNPDTAVLMFAPSNHALEAFLDVFRLTKDALLGKQYAAARDALLKYHVVDGMTGPLTNGTLLTTELGGVSPLLVTVNSTGTYIDDKDGFKIKLGPEIVAGKSKVHDIDTVLTPPTDVLLAAALAAALG